MRELKNEEMKNVLGGADPVIVSSIVGAVIAFLIGAFKGYTNPQSCRN